MYFLIFLFTNSNLPTVLISTCRNICNATSRGISQKGKDASAEDEGSFAKGEFFSSPWPPPLRILRKDTIEVRLKNYETWMNRYE